MAVFFEMMINILLKHIFRDTIGVFGKKMFEN